MDLSQLQREWDAFGRSDPLWAILTDPERRGNRWDPVEFFDTGRHEVAALFQRAAAFELPVRRRRALDFGCGVGRLTQALASHVDEAFGVDIAPSMIELARRYNASGHRCSYEVNHGADLRRFTDATFDVVYTSRVLQHIEPRYAEAYVAELARVLAPGGYLEFDVPSEHGFFAPEGTGQSRPASAYRATVRLLSAPATLAPGERGIVRADVANDGTETWRDTDLKVGNHWADPDGSVLVRDDARAGLDLPWVPGDHRIVELHVTAPTQPGVYRMQLDVVEEHVTWFAEAGSPHAEATVIVGADLVSTVELCSRPEPASAPQMEMHAVPRATVERLLAAAGVRLLDVRRSYHCGPTWLTFRYAVTR